MHVPDAMHVRAYIVVTLAQSLKYGLGISGATPARPLGVESTPGQERLLT